MHGATRRNKVTALLGTLLLAALLAGGLHAPLAHADFIALSSTRGIGNQDNHPGTLGMDFNVLTTISVTQLGVFDSSQNGFVNPIKVGVFNRDNELLLISAVLPSGTTAPLIGQARFIDIPDYVLGVGRYSIVAQGFGVPDPNGNTAWAVMGATNPTIDTGGGAITFVGSARYGGAPALVYPDMVDTGPANRYDAGTFAFTVIPEPSSLALLGVALGALGLTRRRKKA